MAATIKRDGYEIKRVPVKEGIRLDTLTEVFGNQNKGAQVILKPSEEIKDGKINNDINMKNIINSLKLLLITSICAGNITIAAANADQAPSNPPQQTNEVIFTDAKGKLIKLSSLKGKVVFINFWATWCPPCVEEIPSIAQLQQTFKNDNRIVFLMVDVDGKLKQSTAFMEKNKYQLVVYAPKNPIPSNFLGNAIPTTVVIGKHGELAARMEGGRNYASPEFQKALTKLMAQ